MRELILLLIILWFAWYFTGGPSRYQEQGPYTTPPAPVGTGETYWIVDN